jgi:hypothetical protein
MYFLDFIPKMDMFSDIFSIEEIAHDIMITNEIAQSFGLYLTIKDSYEIIIARNTTLKNYGRIEIGTEIANKIIIRFCSSPYIQQWDYCDTLIEVQKLFHYIKNELNDDIGDDELIDKLADAYDHKCFGAFELLKGRETEELIRYYKYGDEDDQDDAYETDEY